MSAPRLINSKPSSQDIMLTEREESNSATPPSAKVKINQNSQINLLVYYYQIS